MPGQHTKVFLLCILEIALMFHVTAEPCPTQDGWRYHDLTGTCMKVVTHTHRNYFDAFNYCLSYHVGNSPRQLVHIYNKGTDDFVKGLLGTNKVREALIGLHDQALNGLYKWTDQQVPFVPYTGWKKNSHVPDGNKSRSSVVITQDGWEEYDRNWQGNFVCQVDAVLPQPTITCPIVEEGQASLRIICSIDVPRQVMSPGHTFYRDGLAVAQIGVESQYIRCRQINVTYGTTGITRCSSSLQIKKVDRSEKTEWSCSVRFINGRETTSSSCNLTVYTLPEKIVCVHNFTPSTLEVTCTTGPMYPQPNCSWDFEKVSPISTNSSSVSGQHRDGFIYYIGVCKISVSQISPGVRNFNLSVSPNITALGTTQTLPVTTQDITVTVELPKEAPTFYAVTGEIIKSPLEVTENHSINITCRIPGGIPPVYRTEIKCFHEQEARTESGNTISINVSITRYDHQQNCSCQGYHLAGGTYTSTVAFLVTHPPTVTHFTIGTKSDISEVNESKVKLFCTASGYPQLELSLLDKDGELILKTADSTYLIHSMTVTCRDMGRYVCLAQNTVGDREHNNNKSVELRVRCKPCYCSQETKIAQYRVVVGRDISFKTCVRAYPRPTSLILYKGNDTYNKLDGSRCNLSFNYTNELTGEGEVNVKISSFTQQDVGFYQLYLDYREGWSVKFHNYLRFQLIAQELPSCPENFTISEIHPDSITLSWKPVFKGDPKQNFTVVRYDSGVASFSPVDPEISQKTEHSDDIMYYNIPGLSESTTYTFGILVRNDEGDENCPHLNVQASTSAYTLSSDGHDEDMMSTVVLIVVGVILVILIAVVVVVLIRRRRSAIQKLEARNKASSETATHQNNSSSSRNNGEESTYANETNGSSSTVVSTERKQFTKNTEQDNTYSQVNKVNKEKEARNKDSSQTATHQTNSSSSRNNGQESTYANETIGSSATVVSKDKKPLTKNADKHEQDNTYSQINKVNQAKGNKTSKENTPSLQNKQKEDPTYVQFGGNANKKGNKLKKHEKENMDEAVVYSNVNRPAAGSGVADDYSVYANAPTSDNVEYAKSSKTRDDGRFVNSEGLIYSVVQINKVTSNPEIISHGKPKVPVCKKAAKPAEERVEYTSIDYGATARQL